jgi:hypothetical protein
MLLAGSLIQNVFNWEPSTLLRDGTELTYRWIYEQMKPHFCVESAQRRRIQITHPLSR